MMGVVGLDYDGFSHQSTQSTEQQYNWCEGKSFLGKIS